MELILESLEMINLHLYESRDGMGFIETSELHQKSMALTQVPWLSIRQSILT